MLVSVYRQLVRSTLLHELISSIQFSFIYKAAITIEIVSLQSPEPEQGKTPF